jgi:polysaccharide biosynthesis/export protein
MKAYKNIQILCTLVLSCLSLVGKAADYSGAGGAVSSSAASPGSALAGIGSVVGENYILKPSDVISVDVYLEPDLNKTVRVEGDGSVALALVGKVKVAGMAVAEAQSLIADLYNRDYLVDPQLTVLVTSFAAKYVRILGSVNRAGVVQIPPDRAMTLTEAIAGVNGINRLGNPKSIIIKRVNQDGSTRQFEVNFTRILTSPDSQDLILEEGDTIWVPERII